MHDRRAHRALVDIAALRDAQRAAARQELFAAQLREREAEEAAARADARTLAAAQAWDAHLESTSFAPEFASALAGALVERGNASAAARAHGETMTRARASAEEEWRTGDARCQVADHALGESSRRRRRDREERLLEMLADRTALTWRRR